MNDEQRAYQANALHREAKESGQKASTETKYRWFVCTPDTCPYHHSIISFVESALYRNSPDLPNPEGNAAKS